MAKPTHLTRLTAQALRVGGVSSSIKGAQPVFPGRVSSNWYPVNLPAATNGTPTNADCLTLLNTLRPILADLVVQQSVLLALSYRTVQPGVAVTSSAVFTVNGVAQGGTTESLFDANTNISESVPVDVVNKNPTLAYDLAVRLAQRIAYEIDLTIGAVAYGSAGFSQTNTALGTWQSGAITSTQITAGIADVKGAGEPIFLVVGTCGAAGGYTNPTVAADGTLFTWDVTGEMGPGFSFVGNPTANTPLVRVLGSPAIHTGGVGTPGPANLLLTPSAMAWASADMGNVTGGSPAITPSGTVQYATSISKDPETGTPQMALQLVIGNTGSGNQAVYVNYLGIAICINPAHGVVIKS